MTGRELIVYILENDLEDEPVIKDGVLLGFMTSSEAAEKFNVGTATINVWLDRGILEGYELRDIIVIPKKLREPKI